MRYLSILLASLFVWSTLAFGQSPMGFQRKVWYKESISLDSTAAETLQIQLPYDRGKGLLAFYIRCDDTECTDTTATHDSLAFDYRPMVGPSASDTCYGSTGAMSWTPLSIYNGPSGSLDDFDNAITWVDSAWYMCVVDMDGYPWRYIELKITQTANDCTECDDSTDIDLYMDID
jgi:hypothetical protein